MRSILYENWLMKELIDKYRNQIMAKMALPPFVYEKFSRWHAAGQEKPKED